MTISRRNVLKGAAGLGMFLPALDAFGQTAAPPPKRAVWVFTANGDQIAQRFTTKGETNFVFADMMSPFERHRQKLLVLDGINKYHDRLPAGEVSDGHEQGGSALAPWRSGMGSFPIGGTCDANGNNCQLIGYVKGPSIDRAIGDRLLMDNPSLPYRHLAIRVGGSGNNIWNMHAHAGPVGTQAPIGPDTNPFTVYTRLFQNIDTSMQQNIARRLAMKRSALDLVNGELNSLKPKVSTADRARLEQHTEAMRDVERQLTATVTGTHPACTGLVMPAMFNPLSDSGTGSTHEKTGLLFFKIIAMSFACDLVRTVNFSWSGNTSDRVYSNLGLTEGHHTISHFSDTTAFGKIRSIKKYLYDQSTKLHDELMALPEAGKTVFDSTLVMHWSELSQGDTHSKSQDCVVLATGSSGVFRTGRMLDFNSAPKRALSNLLVSCWQFFGYNDVTSWGDPLLMPGGTGPLPGLV
ncbi:MAG: DUF1552 domain-containing protein [Archangiaceae bacterium]|nr:DUF1552 domain-containing protein [Archangiaceae bacterium]